MRDWGVLGGLGGNCDGRGEVMFGWESWWNVREEWVGKLECEGRVGGKEREGVRWRDRVSVRDWGCWMAWVGTVVGGER